MSQRSQLLVQIPGAIVVLALDGDGGQGAQRVGILGLKRQDSLEGLRGAIQVLEFPAGQAQVDQRFHPIGALLDAEFEGVDGSGEIAALDLEETQAEGGVLPIRFQADQFGEAPFGFLRAALALIEQRQVPQQARANRERDARADSQARRAPWRSPRSSSRTPR